MIERIAVLIETADNGDDPTSHIAAILPLMYEVVQESAEMIHAEWARWPWEFPDDAEGGPWVRLRAYCAEHLPPSIGHYDPEQDHAVDEESGECFTITTRPPE